MREIGQKQTGKGKDGEEEEEREIEKEDEVAALETWEIRQRNRHKENKTLTEMGFNKKEGTSSRGGRIRKREQY